MRRESIGALVGIKTAPGFAAIIVAANNRDQEVGDTAIWALRDSMDHPRMRQLILALKNDGGEVFNPKEAETIIANSLNLLGKDNYEYRQVGAHLVLGLQEEKITLLLANHLADWHLGPLAARALEDLGYGFAKPEEKVYRNIALRDRQALIDDLQLTTSVLKRDLASDNLPTRENAILALIGLGLEQDVVPTLIAGFNKKGNRYMANVFLNSGRPELEAEARKWAADNGYDVQRIPGSSTDVSWGRMK